MGKQAAARETLAAMHSHLFACVNDQAAEIASAGDATDGGVLRAKARYDETSAEYQAVGAALKAMDDNTRIAAERDQLRAEVDRLRASGARIEVCPGELMCCSRGHETALYRLEDGCVACRITARTEAAEKDAAACRKEYASLLTKSGDTSDRLVAAEAQLAVASNNARHYAAQCETLEATVAGLRGALEPFATGGVVEILNREDYSVMKERIVDWHGVSDFRNAATAFTANPAQHAARIQAEALREAAKVLEETPPYEWVGTHREGWDHAAVHLRHLAAEKEATNDHR